MVPSKYASSSHLFVEPIEKALSFASFHNKRGIVLVSFHNKSGEDSPPFRPL